VEDGQAQLVDHRRARAGADLGVVSGLVDITHPDCATSPSAATASPAPPTGWWWSSPPTTRGLDVAARYNPVI